MDSPAWSGAMSPARAPPSMAMLQMDMRASMEKFFTASPANSITHPVPPAVPRRSRYTLHSRKQGLETGSFTS